MTINVKVVKPFLKTLVGGATACVGLAAGCYKLAGTVIQYKYIKEHADEAECLGVNGSSINMTSKLLKKKEEKTEV